MAMDGTRNEFDFAVIGGGLVGAAIAWGLASRGRNVAMLDEGDIAYPRLARQFCPGLGAEQGRRHVPLRDVDAAIRRCMATARRSPARGNRSRCVSCSSPAGFTSCCRNAKSKIAPMRSSACTINLEWCRSNTTCSTAPRRRGCYPRLGLMWPAPAFVRSMAM